MLWYVQLLSFLIVTGFGVYQFSKAVRSRYKFIRLGEKPVFEAQTKKRVRSLIRQMFGHSKLLKDRKSGIMHAVMFYGFIVLQFGALDLIWKGLVPDSHLPMPAYRYFLFIQEVTVTLVLSATGYAAYRRYVEKLKRLKRGWKPSIVLFFIGGLMISVLLSSSFEMVWQGSPASVFRPVSSVIAGALTFVTPGFAKAAFFVCWWLHLLILLSFLIYIPQSKHAHLIAAPINIFMQRLHAPGKLSLINFEDESNENYGKGKIEDFSQKQLLDLYACVECGRCTSMCPAAATGKMLSPMHLITKMRDHLTAKGAAVTSLQPFVPFGPKWAMDTEVTTSSGYMKKLEEVSLIGDVISEQELWACTTCRNCEDQCPVMNEHVDKIVDMRRHLVMMEGSLPSESQRAITNIERQGNPWGISRNNRIKWREECEDVYAPTVHEETEFEYLYYVGSMASFDIRGMKVAQSFAKLMNQAGVRFAILGNEEKNSGDTPRRIGNEYLFQQLAQENVEMFRKYKVTKIVTTDPHAYNTFKNEYPDFGLEAEVYHHTELLAKLVKEGRLKPVRPLKHRITYHDSCYLGRYNGVYEEPRELLRAIPGVELVEMRRSKQDAMCCGAGGGIMWTEESEGSRVNVARVEQAMEVQPTLIASACPYCLTMIQDGTKMKDIDHQIVSKDIAEILAEVV